MTESSIQASRFVPEDCSTLTPQLEPLTDDKSQRGKIVWCTDAKEVNQACLKCHLFVGVRVKPENHPQ